MRALIVEEGFTTGALSAARALASCGWFVGIGSPRARGLASSSRFVSGRHWVPRPTDDLDGFVDATNRAVRAGGYDIVFPSGDAELLALSLARDRLDVLVPYPPHEVVLRTLDKLHLAESVRDVGVASPETFVPTEARLSGLVGKVVVKTRLHGLPGTGPRPSRLEAIITSEPREAAKRVGEIRLLGGEPVLQRFVEGKLLIYTGVVDREGAVRASVQHEAERIWPPKAGFSCRAITTPVDAVLERRLTSMLVLLGWVGLAQFQMIVPPGGPPHVIDFNGRFYASLESAMAAGVNFPVIWAELSLGLGRPRERIEGKPGVRYQWLEGDLSRAIRERRGGLMVDIMDCLRVAPNAHHAVWRRDDPTPALRSLVHVAAVAWAKLGGALARTPARFRKGADSLR